MLSVTELESQTRELAESLGVSNAVVDRSVEYAVRAYSEHPINRAPSSIAAAAVYAAALLENEKQTQAVVADAADTSVVSIRYTYREIIEHEGYDLPDRSEQTQPSGGRPPGIFQRARDLLGGDI